jgi:hypothetical protein
MGDSEMKPELLAALKEALASGATSIGGSGAAMASTCEQTAMGLITTCEQTALGVITA